MNILNALAALGARATIRGGREPTTAEEYAGLVDINGDRPAWPVVEAKAAEISRANRILAIRNEAARRIEAMYPTNMQSNIARAGGPALVEMSAFIDAIRARSNVLEAAPPDGTADGWTWGSPVPTLDEVKVTARAKVDAAAEAERLKYITPGDAMQMTYREKFEQAQGVNAMGEAAANALTEQQRLAQFPTLAASIGLEGVTLWGVAHVVLTKYTQFAALSYSIERTRLSGKKAISDASSAEAVKAAYEAITWTTP